jgi:hypothetical protein
MKSGEKNERITLRNFGSTTPVPLDLSLLREKG